MNTLKIGSVWTANAKLYNKDNILIGYCLDTPNAIAKAFMECSDIFYAIGLFGKQDKSNFIDCMKDWNNANSHLQLITAVNLNK